MRNFQRAAQHRHSRDAIISGLGCVLATQGKRPRIQGGIVEDEADAAVIKPSPAVAVIAEGESLRERGCSAVELAAVDEEAVSSAVVEVLLGWFSLRIVAGRWLGFRALGFRSHGRHGRWRHARACPGMRRTDLRLDLIEW